MHKTVFVTAKDNRSLNELADFALENAATSVEKLEKFELIIGQGTLLGGGEPPITRIKLTALIENPSADFENDLDIILSLLAKRATELDIDLKFESE